MFGRPFDWNDHAAKYPERHATRTVAKLLRPSEPCASGSKTREKSTTHAPSIYSVRFATGAGVIVCRTSRPGIRATYGPDGKETYFENSDGHNKAMKNQKTQDQHGGGSPLPPSTGSADWGRFQAPNWRNPLECVFHPIMSALMLFILVIGYFCAGVYVWFWNVRNSSSIHGCWRPRGPWDDMPNDQGDL